MDATELALLRAICAEPGEDTPRLALADWLDENNQPARAEFIRVQVELAEKYPGWSGVPAQDCLARGGRYDDLRRRERELFGIGTSLGWFLDIFPAWCCLLCEWRRGFPAHLTLEAEAWTAHSDYLRKHPVTEVTLTTPPQPVGNASGALSVSQWALTRWKRIKGTANDWTHPHWPGVTFHLPTYATVNIATGEPGPAVPLAHWHLQFYTP